MGTPIDDTVANLVCAQLLHLESDNPDKDISVYINSPGGDITALFAIYDTMQYLKNNVSTMCLGQAASAAAVVLGAGTKGKRFALPHARILIHQPSGGATGQAVDIEIQAKEIVRMRDLLEEILASHTGQPRERIHKDSDRDARCRRDTSAWPSTWRRSTSAWSTAWVWSAATAADVSSCARVITSPPGDVSYDGTPWRWGRSPDSALRRAVDMCDPPLCWCRSEPGRPSGSRSCWRTPASSSTAFGGAHPWGMK